ncbi:MAG: uracil-DNA glycosylase [Vicinamibacteria bacterium]
MDADSEDLKGELLEQIGERLRYYASITTVGLPRRDSTSAPSETLEAIREELGECTRCKLHKNRRTLVYGVGNPNADLMFVGEGPGYEEDVQGIPFVGPAGQLLTKIIEAIQLTRDDVYIANVVKCRPPGNRDPEPDEIATCRPFLERQVASVRPRVICTLGRIATQAMLSTEKPLGRMRGQKFPFGDAVVVPTYHPAALLRDPSKKRDTWEDMKLIRALLDGRR